MNRKITSTSVKLLLNYCTKLSLLFVLMLGQQVVHAQGNVLSGTGAGSFEGASLAADGWSVVNNAATAIWVNGTAAFATNGVKGAYISTVAAGTNNNYNNGTTRWSHLYRDITFPAGATAITMTFKWRCQGEPSWDWTNVIIGATTTVPVVTGFPAGTTITTPLNGTGTTINTFTVSLSPATYNGTTKRLFFSWRNDGSGSYSPGIGLDQIDINSVVPVACSGVPTTTATAPATVCKNVTFALSCSPSLIGYTGVTYQWQSATALAGPYNNIAGATTETYNVTGGIATTTYYHLNTFCTPSGLGYTTNNITVTPAQCVSCVSNATNTADEDITNVQVSTLNNSSSCSQTYQDFRFTVAAPTLNAGGTYPMSINLATCGGLYGSVAGVYIDFNQNGLLTDAGELVWSQYYSGGAPGVTSFSINVPAGATGGITQMRVVWQEGYTVPFPCNTYTYGETEDYFVNIYVPPACSGTPTAGSISATQTSGCPGYTSTLSLPTATIAAGIAYQWQSGPTATGPWTNVGTNSTYVATVNSNIYYQCTVTCTPSGQSATTPAILLSATPHTVATLPFTESFETWVNFCATSDVPTSSVWGNTPATGNNAWRRDDQGATAGWTSTNGAYTPVFSVGAHSARFHTYNAASTSTGALDLYVDFSAAGTKTITYDYINTSGTDNVVVQVSTTGAAGPWTNLGTANTAATWTPQTVTTTAVANPAIVRFMPTSDFGTTDIGIDNVSIVPPPVACTGAPTLGAATATPTAASCSTSPALALASYPTNVLQVTYQWQSAPAAAGPWTNIGAALATPPFTAPTITATTYYRCIGTCNATGQSTTSSTVTVNVTGVTASPATATICKGATQALVATSPPVAGTLFSENFNTGNVMSVTPGPFPAGQWAVQNNGYVYSLWTFNSPTASKFIMANSDVTGAGNAVSTQLITPVMNSNGYASLTLTYNTAYHYFGAGSGFVQVSTNGAAGPWTTLLTYATTDVGASNAFAAQTVNLNSYINQSNLCVRFSYEATYQWWWCIDDVVISGAGGTPSFQWTVNPAANAGLPVAAQTMAAANSNISVTPTAAGVYTYTVSSNAPGCLTASSVITVTDPGVISAVPTNPSTCSGTNGSILFSGLTPSTNYNFHYNATTTAITTNASGQYNFTGLAAGSYTNLYFILGSCTTNVLGPIVLTDPPIPAISGITKTDPTTCAGVDGTFTISGLLNTTAYSLVYNGGTPQAITTDGVGNYTKTGLSAGNYTNIYVVRNNCTSNTVGPVVLTDPAAPIISSTSKVDPDSCNKPRGSITLSGLLTTTAYNVSYNGNPTTSITSDALGNVVIPTLMAGTYNNIYVVRLNCTSNVVGPIVLVDPAVPTANASNNSPVCEGFDVNLTGASNTAGVNWSWTGPSYASTQQSPTITAAIPANSGTYTLVTDYNNCYSLPSTTSVTVNPTPATPSASSNTPVCSTNSLDFTGNCTTPSVTFTWTGPGFAVPNTNQNPSIPNVQVSASGTYTLTATTAANCVSAPTTTSVLIKQTPTITSWSSFDPTSCGGSQGSITLNGLVSGTTYNTNFDRNGNPQTPQAIMANGSGSVVIPTLNAASYDNITLEYIGCTSLPEGPIQLNDPNQPVLSNFVPADPLTCGGSQGSITLNADSAGYPINGPVLLHYMSSNIATPQVVSTIMVGGIMQVTALPQGTYTDFVLDGPYGCSSVNYPGPITLSDPNPPVISGTSKSDPSTCFGSDGSITLQGLQPSTTFSVTYTKGANVINGTVTTDAAGNGQINSLSSTTYSNIFVTLNNCVSASVGPITLVDPSNPVVTAFNNTPVCEGQTVNFSSIVTLNGNPAIANSYAWTGPAFANPVNQANPSITNATVAASGTYTVTATIANCVSAPFTLSAIVDPQPQTPVLSSNTPVCSGNDLHLDVASPVAGNTYVWSGPGLATPDSTANATIAYAQTTASGTYNMSVTTPSGCTLLTPANITVVVNQTPSAPMPDGFVYCQSEPAVALTATPSGNPADTLKWYFAPTGGTGTTVPPVPNTAVAGTFTWYVTQTTAANCENVQRVPQVVIVKPTPSLPVSSAPQVVYCQFDSTATPLIAVGDSLQWYNIPTGGVASMTAPTPSTDTPGTFTWYVSQIKEGCEGNRLPIVVTINPKPQPPVTAPVRYCQFDKPVALTTVGTDLKWYATPQGGTPLASAPIPSTDVPGTYTWYVSQTLINCESDLRPIAVTVYYKPTVSIGSSSDEVCQGETLTFTYSGNGTSTANYLWGWPAGSTVVSGTGSGPLVVRFDYMGRFDIPLTVSEDGCSTTASHMINVKQTPQLTIRPQNTEACVSQQSLIDIAFVDMNIMNYVWNFGSASVTDGNSAVQNYNAPGPFYATWNQEGSDVVSLYVQATNGCYSQPSSDHVTIHALPDAKIQAATTSVACSGDSLMLSAGVNNVRYSYQWTPVESFRVDQNSAVAFAYIDRSGYINLSVSNEFGCVNKDSIMITANGSCCELLLPSAFSPNGDGKNDLFRIINPGRHKLLSLTVYNRYGQSVFTTSNERQGWDGSVSGVAQEMGVYYYLAKLECDGKDITQKGEVTLVR